jgi:hypothetical protein
MSGAAVELAELYAALGPLAHRLEELVILPRGFGVRIKAGTPRAEQEHIYRVCDVFAARLKAAMRPAKRGRPPIARELAA